MNNDSKIKYNYLVLATGSTSNYYGIEEEKYTYPLKTSKDAINIKQKIIELTSNIKNEKIDINIIGAGPTGIELSLEIKDILVQIEKRKKEKINYNINLINATNSILPQLKEKNQNYVKNILKKEKIKLILSASVKKINKNSIEYNQTTLNSSITIWTAGVKPNTTIIEDRYLDKNKRIIVNEYLQIPTLNKVFALGDIITQLEQRIPPLAQTATKQAQVIAQNINRTKNNNKKLIKYIVSLKGVFISLGSKKAIGEIKNLTIKGRLGWFIYRTIYLTKMPGTVNKIKIMFSWTINLFSKKDLVEE